MEDYVRQHSAGTLVRSTFRIYGRKFFLLFISSLIPAVPLIAVQVFRIEPKYSLIPILLMALASLLNVAPTTVLISDICVGNEPGLARAYRRAFGKVTGTVLLTFFLVLVWLVIGSLFLIVPGIVFGCWFMFAIVVAILERTSAREALRRSRQLGKGHYLRNLGLYILIMVLTWVPMLIVSFIVGAVGALVEAPDSVIRLLGNFVGLLSAPPLGIVIVLLYYDMRVRSEAYDSTKLAEDLRH